MNRFASDPLMTFFHIFVQSIQEMRKFKIFLAILLSIYFHFLLQLGCLTIKNLFDFGHCLVLRHGRKIITICDRKLKYLNLPKSQKLLLIFSNCLFVQAHSILFVSSKNYRFQNFHSFLFLCDMWGVENKCDDCSNGCKNNKNWHFRWSQE